MSFFEETMAVCGAKSLQDRKTLAPLLMTRDKEKCQEVIAAYAQRVKEGKCAPNPADLAKLLEQLPLA